MNVDGINEIICKAICGFALARNRTEEKFESGAQLVKHTVSLN